MRMRMIKVMIVLEIFYDKYLEAQQRILSIHSNVTECTDQPTFA